MTVKNRGLGPEDEAEAIRLFLLGVPAYAIAAKYDRSASALHGLFRRRGIKGGLWKATKFDDPKFIAMRAAGKTIDEIAAAFGVTSKKVEWWAQKAIRAGLIAKKPTGFGGDPWTLEESERLKTLWETMGPAEISRVTGWTLSRINGRIARLKLPRKGYPTVRASRKPSAAKPPKVTAAEQRAVREAAREAAAAARKAVAEVMWTPSVTSRPFLERERGQCAWPMGDRNDQACCAPTKGRDSYCPDHRLLAGGQRTERGYAPARQSISRGRASVFDRGQASL